jgi:hypothetical protein
MSRTLDASTWRELAGGLERRILGGAEGHAARILFVRAPQVNDGAALPPAIEVIDITMPAPRTPPTIAGAHFDTLPLVALRAHPKNLVVENG